MAGAQTQFEASLDSILSGIDADDASGSATETRPPKMRLVDDPYDHKWVIAIGTTMGLGIVLCFAAIVTSIAAYSITRSNDEQFDSIKQSVEFDPADNVVNFVCARCDASVSPPHLDFLGRAELGEETAQGALQFENVTTKFGNIWFPSRDAGDRKSFFAAEVSGASKSWLSQQVQVNDSLLLTDTSRLTFFRASKLESPNRVAKGLQLGYELVEDSATVGPLCTEQDADAHSIQIGYALPPDAVTEPVARLCMCIRDVQNNNVVRSFCTTDGMSLTVLP